ncbi:trans-acting factor B [Notoacmeibacter ruber]|uniref:trans-acting factor B n=1 Tax=Notoacmeibacter ruber TaxID=2670375 RepID=UPI0011C4050B|nr:trans-acting factor B [Notoacmeibacter ruber]
MKTLMHFCRRTGRLMSRIANKLIRHMTHKGQLRITVAFTIPFIAKLEFGYRLELGKTEQPS